MSDSDDLHALMGISSAQFRVLIDYDIGAVVVEVRTDDVSFKANLSPEAAVHLARSLTACWRKLTDRREED